MIVSLYDYGTGNLHSLTKGLEAGGGRVQIDANPAAALRADALVLPGVGAFGAAAARLAPAATLLRQALIDGLPCLGICLGMQLLFEASDEGPGRGLGVFQGRVRRLRADRLPQMGWNSLETRPDPLFCSTHEPLVYYANTFVAEPAAPEQVIAWTTYGQDRFAAAVRRCRTWGVQFHPEKSGTAGLQLLRNFLHEAAR
ncbi:MAG: imidazole glycerol phosphate synthase subunit HisH [Acidobacteriota bacterium]